MDATASQSNACARVLTLLRYGLSCARVQAHFFSVSDLDMIWRSVMHAHLFNARFGDMIEFHTASCGVYVRVFCFACLFKTRVVVCEVLTSECLTSVYC